MTAFRKHTGLTEVDVQMALALIAGTDVSELEVVTGNTRLLLQRQAVAVGGSVSSAQVERLEAQGPLAVTSPLVGVVRLRVSPGDHVRQGQEVGVIEALGLPTTVEAPHEGEIVELLVEDGSAVEYGQPLVSLRRADRGASL